MGIEIELVFISVKIGVGVGESREINKSWIWYSGGGRVKGL